MQNSIIKLWPGELSTDDDANDDGDNTRWTIHDCTGSLAFVSNESTRGTVHKHAFLLLRNSQNTKSTA